MKLNKAISSSVSTSAEHDKRPHCIRKSRQLVLLKNTFFLLVGEGRTNLSRFQSRMLCIDND